MKRITKDQDLHLSQHSSNEMLSAALSVREGNILIAEFMGYVYLPDGKINGLKGILVHEDKMSIHLDVTKQFHAKYHSSWDWLMPVVEKIEKLDDCNFSFFIVQTECDIAFSSKCNNKGEDYFAPNFAQKKSDKIKSTWSAVVEFIKWYNDNAVFVGSR